MSTETSRLPLSARATAALVIALLAACIAFQLNASMLSPALVTMARELRVSEATTGLSQTVFFTSAALFSLFLPRLSDIVGRKRILLGMLAVMLVGNVVSATAPNIWVLYVGRILQGTSGPVVPMALLMLRWEVTEPKRYGTLMGVVTAVNGGIAGVDALAGGFLATYFGFRSIFWCTAVIAVIALIMVWLWCRDSRPSAGTSMDWLGVGTLVVCVGCLLIALNEAEQLAAANWVLVGILALVAIAAFASFWWQENHAQGPLASPQDLRRRHTWALLLTTTLTLTGVFASINGLAISLAQNRTAGFGLKADVASLLLLTPFSLVGWLVGPFAGRLAPSLGYRAVLRIGLIGSVVSIALMAILGVHSIVFLVAGALLLGITYAGTANIMLNGLGIVLSPPHNPGFLPGMNAGAFNLGAGLSFVILPVLQVAGSPAGSHSPAGYVSGLLLGMVIIGAALAVSFLIPRPVNAEDASLTVRERTGH